MISIIDILMAIMIFLGATTIITTIIMACILNQNDDIRYIRERIEQECKEDEIENE